MQIHGRVCSSYPIRHHIAPVGIDQNRAVAWRKGALVAVVARADPARQADAGSGLRRGDVDPVGIDEIRSEEHTSELQSLMRISYAVFCLNKNKARSGRTATTNTL